MQILDDTEIATRIASAMHQGGGVEVASPSSSARYVRPLIEAAEQLIEALQIPEGIGFGMAELDVYTRGFRPTDFVIVTGFAHSGKTQIVNTMIANNPDKKVLLFTLDDPAPMLLAKLVAMITDVPAEMLEKSVRDGDEGASRLVREVAVEKLPNLLIVDEVLDIKSMKHAVAEATEVWGQHPDCIVVDYLEMIPGTVGGEGENVKRTANKLKRWAKHLECPLICLHQGTRSNARLGAPITLLSMGHSGEQQATIVVGCRRKRDWAELDEHDRLIHMDTITIHIVKNKRPGARCTAPDGIDFKMKWETGLISPLSDPERRHVQGLPPASAHVKLNGSAA